MSWMEQRTGPWRTKIAAAAAAAAAAAEAGLLDDRLGREVSLYL